MMGGRHAIVLIALCATLAGCTDRRASPAGRDVYIIQDDGGGQLLSAEADRLALRGWGGPVEIRGKCASACVIFTTLPNACIAPDARIGFHGSSITMGPVGNPQIARHLRAGVRARFLEEWQFVPPDQIRWISPAEYKRLDPLVKICR